MQSTQPGDNAEDTVDESSRDDSVSLRKQSWHALPPTLWQKYLHRIVDCNDAQYLARIVNDGKCEQIVFGDLLRHLRVNGVWPAILRFS